jgi:hypothetical protein
MMTPLGARFCRADYLVVMVAHERNLRSVRLIERKRAAADRGDAGAVPTR